MFRVFHGGAHASKHLAESTAGSAGLCSHSRAIRNVLGPPRKSAHFGMSLPVYDPITALQAEYLGNLRLTTERSAKDTRHITARAECSLCSG